uniref:Uncharacterized protein n=1 Tax=Nonomuraea gerenzanensis TaxID=93944 RepID=A0A1M4E0H2_9ACTN|nr:hypothetical protein BN4615_P1829 [Nonomuraea gerenzanensis]
MQRGGGRCGIRRAHAGERQYGQAARACYQGLDPHAERLPSGSYRRLDHWPTVHARS